MTRLRPRRFIATCVATIWVGLAVWCASASADDSDDKPPEGKTDFNLLPIVGGTTDIGFGVGEFMGIARVQQGVSPYVWNLESEGLITFLPGSHGLEVPYQDISFTLTVPRLFGAPLKLKVRPSYTNESTLNYSGLGNASPTPDSTSDPTFWYTRAHPSMLVSLRGQSMGHFSPSMAVRYTYNRLSVAPGSKLAADMRGGSPVVKDLLGTSVAPHSVALFAYGMQWDNRDNQISTHSGSFDEAVLWVSPGGTPEFPYRYGRGTLNMRFFFPLGSRVTLALHAVGDILFGHAPFYELARYDDDNYAIGGPNGVRGVPAERYYGDVKAFGNAEVRVDVASFHLFGKKALFGLVPFFDAGRVWTDLTPHPELDGSGVGLKYGTGLGLRLRSGEAFVLRADIAWSPDAQPIGGYLAAGELF